MPDLFQVSRGRLDSRRGRFRRVVEAVERRERTLAQVLRVGQQLALSIKDLVFARHWSGPEQLFRLVAQQVQAVQSLLLVALHSAQGLGALSPLLVGRAKSAGLIAQPGIDIDHAQLRCWRQQGLLLVLAMDVSEVGSQLPEFRQSGRRAVDIGAALARSENMPLEDQLIVLAIAAAIFRRQLRGHARSTFETPADTRLAGSRAYDIRAGARTEQQCQGINDDGLAAAGLTGQEVEARVEFDSELVHHGIALNVEFLKHEQVIFRSDSGRPTSGNYIGGRM